MINSSSGQSTQAVTEKSKTPTLAEAKRHVQKELQDLYLSRLDTANIDLPKTIYSSSQGDDIEEMRLRMMMNIFDRANFDIFLKTAFGKYLLEDLNNPDKVEQKGITKVSEFIKENNTYIKATKRVKLDACSVISRHNKDRFKIDLKRKDQQSKKAKEMGKVCLENMSKTELFDYYFDYLKDKILTQEQKSKIKLAVQEELQKL